MIKNYTFSNSFCSRLKVTNYMYSRFLTALTVVHLLVRTFVGSHSVGAGEALRRDVFRVNVRVFVLVVPSHSDHCPLVYLQAAFLLLRFLPPDAFEGASAVVTTLTLFYQ